ncbi:MAG TPA: hypothetical protein VJN18_15010 [Polyangiaceae bacterium]|nr:hypothetical protein [Polyangiaceae bacterium]
MTPLQERITVLIEMDQSAFRAAAREIAQKHSSRGIEEIMGWCDPRLSEALRRELERRRRAAVSGGA